MHLYTLLNVVCTRFWTRIWTAFVHRSERTLNNVWTHSVTFLNSLSTRIWTCFWPSVWPVYWPTNSNVMIIYLQSIWAWFWPKYWPNNNSVVKTIWNDYYFCASMPGALGMADRQKSAAFYTIYTPWRLPQIRCLTIGLAGCTARLDSSM